MGELDRKAAANNIRITKSHLWAGGVGVSAALLLVFSVGFYLGGAGAQSSQEMIQSDRNHQAYLRHVAKFEKKTESVGNNKQIGQAVSAGTVVSVEPPESVVIADSAPNGTHTVLVARHSEGAAAKAHRDSIDSVHKPWLGSELVNGERVYLLYIGGFTSSEAAHSALSILVTDGVLLPPQVVPLVNRP